MEFQGAAGRIQNQVTAYQALLIVLEDREKS